MFKLFKERRRRRRRPQDPVKQIGNAAGKVLAGAILGGLKSLFKK
jgi:hypothetical protein